MSSAKRRDNKNRILNRGESQRQDGRYTYFPACGRFYLPDCSCYVTDYIKPSKYQAFH